MDFARMPVIGAPVTGRPLASIKRQASAPEELAGALTAVVDRLKAAKNCVLLPGAMLARQVIRLDIADPALCLRLFKANRDVGLAIAAALLLGRL